MNINEAAWDRTLRIVLGIALLSLLFVGPKTWWGLIGLVPLVTGVSGWCPAYELLGISTCAAKKEKPHKIAVHHT